VRVAFLLSHGPHAHFRVLTFLTRPTRGPRTPRRGCVATQFFFLMAGLWMMFTTVALLHY
jgi:hypothetical protein